MERPSLAFACSVRARSCSYTGSTASCRYITDAEATQQDNNAQCSEYFKLSSQGELGTRNISPLRSPPLLMYRLKRVASWAFGYEIVLCKKCWRQKNRVSQLDAC